MTLARPKNKRRICEVYCRGDPWMALARARKRLLPNCAAGWSANGSARSCGWVDSAIWVWEAGIVERSNALTSLDIFAASCPARPLSIMAKNRKPLPAFPAGATWSQFVHASYETPPSGAIRCRARGNPLCLIIHHQSGGWLPCPFQLRPSFDAGSWRAPTRQHRKQRTASWCRPK